MEDQYYWERMDVSYLAHVIFYFKDVGFLNQVSISLRGYNWIRDNDFDHFWIKCSQGFKYFEKIMRYEKI